MNRLKELRIQAGLSQFQLAHAAETTQRNISYWESGRIEMSLNAAIKLAQVLQVEVEYLAGYSDEFNNLPNLNTNISAPIGDALTSEERELVNRYRTLPDKIKKLIREQIEVYSEPNELLPKTDK